MRARPPAPARHIGSAIMALGSAIPAKHTAPITGVLQEWAYDICSFFGSQCKNHRVETATFGSAMCRWSPALLSTIRAGISPAPHGVDCPRRLHRLGPLDCRLGRRHAGNGEWGGRKQGPHLISDSAIANTAGMGEATGKAVKGDPLSAAFVLGKFALRDYGNPCAEPRELEELVARNPRARCRENVSGTGRVPVA